MITWKCIIPFSQLSCKRKYNLNRYLFVLLLKQEKFRISTSNPCIYVTKEKFDVWHSSSEGENKAMVTNPHRESPPEWAASWEKKTIDSAAPCPRRNRFSFVTSCRATRPLIHFLPPLLLHWTRRNSFWTRLITNLNFFTYNYCLH